MLSVCIPYYAGLSYLEDCLRTIHEHPPDRHYEVLVVEDASPEPCATAVQRHFPDVRILANSRNLGFGSTANRAVSICRGDHVLILNADTRVFPGSLEALCAYLDRDPEAGAVGPMILNEDGTFQAQCRRGRLTAISALGYGLGLDTRVSPDSRLAEYLRPHDPPERALDVEALSGSCMLLRREALEEVGGFDESLFLYGEDLDLCYRMRDRGWRVRYLPESRIVHLGGRGGTTLRFRYFRSLYHYHRSAYVVLRRNSSRSFRLFGWLFAVALGGRFLLGAARRVLGHRRVGTPKRAGIRPSTRRPEPSKS